MRRAMYFKKRAITPWGLGKRKLPQRRPSSLGRHNHRHLAAFHAWMRLDLCELAEVGFHPVEQSDAELLVHHLPAAKAQGDLDLVAFLEEADHGLSLDLVIVVADARAQLDFLDLDDLLLLAGLVGLLLK